MRVEGKRFFKPVYGIVSKEEAKRHVALAEEYIAYLRSIGVNVPETVFHLEQEAKGVRIVIEQPLFAESEFLSTILSSGSEEEVKKAFEQTLRMLLHSFTRANHKLTATIDINSGNFAIRGDKVYYIDVFPPLFLAKEKRVHRGHMSLPSRLKSGVLPLRIQGSPPYLVSRFVLSCSDLRPQMKKWFVRRAKQLLHEQLPPELREKYMHYLSPFWISFWHSLRKARNYIVEKIFP
ncbi:MAG: hypothetical protein J7L14_01395 [Candidatus Diapherotrites archaeon]|nr:hypothetical protein [Candidatus Diapherotrites archaeon]